MFPVASMYHLMLMPPKMSAINEWVANNTKGKGVSAPIDVPVTPSVGDIDPIEVPAGVGHRPDG